MIPKQLPDEEEIVLRAMRGNEKAFTQLITHYDKFIYNIACKYADLDADREEVVQEAMLKVWQNISKFKGQSKFSTWLYVVVKNDSYKCLTDRRKIPSHPYNSKSLYQDSDEDNVEELGDNITAMLKEQDIDSTSPESLYRASELYEAIFIEAEKLNKDLYETWWLREVELLTYDQIALETNSPIGTVKSRLFNAREILNENLKEYLGGESGRFELTQ